MKMGRKVANNLQPLADRWDEDDVCRKHVRRTHALLCNASPTFHATVKACSDHCEAILPVLELTKILVFN